MEKAEINDPENHGKGKGQNDNRLHPFEQRHPVLSGSPFGRDEAGDDENGQKQDQEKKIDLEGA